MIPELRSEFTRKFSTEKYREVQASIESKGGVSVGFRLAESPIFIPHSLAQTAAKLAAQLIEHSAKPELQETGNSAIPKDFCYAGETATPLFSAVDFAITNSAQEPELKLIELQGFPSLWHFQAEFSQAIQEVYDLKGTTGLLQQDMNYDAYFSLLRDNIVGHHSPEEVGLVELDPNEQKTAIDFRLAQKHLRIPIVNIRDIIAKGRELHYRDERGRMRPLRRIYNRAIHDDIQRKEVQLPFDVSNEYNVEWAGHPNWYFKISKVLLPKLVGLNDAVPNAFLLSDVEPRTLDLSKYVLKPLYSFAGAGVSVGPTLNEVEGISHYARDKWLLQERVEYAEVIRTPDGPGVKAELRVLVLWPEHDRQPKALHTLVRLTRGKMVGVDFNKGLDWVGSSCGLIA